MLLLYRHQDVSQEKRSVQTQLCQRRSHDGRQNFMRLRKKQCIYGQMQFGSQVQPLGSQSRTLGRNKVGFFSDGERGLEEEAMYPLNEISVYIFCTKQACEKFIQMNNNSSWWYDIR